MKVTNHCSCREMHDLRPAEQMHRGVLGFPALRKALESGDADSAKEALARIQKNLENIQNHGRTPRLLDADTQAGKDFQALQAAVDAGDLETAKTAFAAVREDLRGIGHLRGHHHHHRHRVESSDSASEAEVDPTIPIPEADPSTPPSVEAPAENASLDVTA